MTTMEETLKKQLLNSSSQPPDEDREQLTWPYCYQIELLKDDLEEIEEAHHRLTKEYKDKTRVSRRHHDDHETRVCKTSDASARQEINVSFLGSNPFFSSSLCLCLCPNNIA